ncbi:MAG: HesA/MoeB/ThiF family protein, partial [Ktedonobacterales bacterium]
MAFLRPCLKRHLHADGLVVAGSKPAAHGASIAFHYGHERGIALEEVDEAQLLLISLLDGQHSFDEIVARLQAHDAGITAENVSQQLDQLAELSLIEDAGVTPPEDLTESDLGRYAGQIRFFSILDTSGKQRYEMQARLKRARVAVLGLGGLGSNVVAGLAAAGVGFIRGIDGDSVEMSNLNRQVLYDAGDIGQAKALAAAEQIRHFNPNITFEPLQEFLASPERIVEVIQDTDVVALCADAPRALYQWMNSAALATGIPFIIGGYRGTTAEVGPFVIPFATSCLGCNIPPQPEAPPAPLAWVNEAFWLRHPTAHFTTAAAASLTCGEIIKHLTGFTSPVTYNAVYTLDFEHMALTSAPRKRDPHCVA